MDSFFFWRFLPWLGTFGIAKKGSPPKITDMEIRHATALDLPMMMDIFAGARAFMAAQGNPNQWGPRAWPPKSLIEKDIAENKSYVIVKNGVIVGTFYLDVGLSPEPAYEHLRMGHWVYGGPYAVIHRIASSFKVKGILETAVSFALTKADHVRIDTHEDNIPMRRGLAKLGFLCCGEVTLPHDSFPRLAFER